MTSRVRLTKCAFICVLAIGFPESSPTAPANTLATTSVKIHAIVHSGNADLDEDGLRDSWEMIHFGDLQQRPDDDTDGDGYPNLLEFINGTDPNQYVLEIVEGWNLLSLASIPLDNAIDSIFAGIPIGQDVWTWRNGRFVHADTISSHAGYWLYSFVDVSLMIGSGNIREFQYYTDNSDYEIDLYHGWNLISLSRVPFDNSIEALFWDRPRQPALWSWQDDRYQRAVELHSLRGYWIYNNGPDSLVRIAVD